VRFFGVSKHGATRWLEVPFGNFTIQPSEIMKIAFILMIGYLIVNDPPDKDDGYTLKQFLNKSFYIILPFILILIQPDLGTALILLFLGFGILFIVGVNYKIWLSLIVSIIIAIPLIYGSLETYQKKRIKDFASEKQSYHVRQSIIAIGSGGLTGQSKIEATQASLKFLPVAESDFIFAYHIERFGFFGALALMLVYIVIILYLLFIVVYSKDDYLIQVLAGSLALLFFLYTGINIAMVIGYAPVVGLPLPLFSYGGSSFMTFVVLIGILENLLSFRYDTLYDSIKYGS
jgi:rod shape determining protein RodA